MFGSETLNLEQNSEFRSHLEFWAYGDYKTCKNWQSSKFSYKLGGPTLELCNFFPIGHLGFLGGQLKRVTLYVLRAAFYDLVMFFLLQLIFSVHIFPSETFPSIVSHSLTHFLCRRIYRLGECRWEENMWHLKSD